MNQMMNYPNHRRDDGFISSYKFRLGVLLQKAEHYRLFHTNDWQRIRSDKYHGYYNEMDRLIGLIINLEKRRVYTP